MGPRAAAAITVKSPIWKTNEPPNLISRRVSLAKTLFKVQKDVLRNKNAGTIRNRGE
jgi:hypothetical protein